MLDEAHHNVHTMNGRYRPFVELIATTGYAVTSNQDPLTKERLKNVDILVIANARGAGQEAPLEERGRPAFTDAEADAVRDWVREGGALLLVTDHYPIGGANQSLAKRFGVEMSDGWTEDPEHRHTAPQEIVFSREDGLLAEHPITREVNRVVTFGGQSLQGPAESVALLRLSPSAMDRLQDDRRVPAAGRSQGIALNFGRGRVVVLADAAMLTSQTSEEGTIGITVPGFDNRRFTLNLVEWLAPPPPPRP
jgi:hypothetical protein